MSQLVIVSINCRSRMFYFYILDIKTSSHCQTSQTGHPLQLQGPHLVHESNLPAGFLPKFEA